MQQGIPGLPGGNWESAVAERRCHVAGTTGVVVKAECSLCCELVLDMDLNFKTSRQGRVCGGNDMQRQTL